MECREFQAQYETFREAPASRLATKEYQRWRAHLDVCRACVDWVQGEEVRRRHIDAQQFPCVHMAYYSAAWVVDDTQPPREAAIVYTPKFDEFGIHLFDGSVIGIRHCPFCGVALPASRREEWFARLTAMGYDDPVDQFIPPEFNTDAWYRLKK